MVFNIGGLPSLDCINLAKQALNHHAIFDADVLAGEVPVKQRHRPFCAGRTQLNSKLGKLGDDCRVSGFLFDRRAVVENGGIAW